jgi:DNA-binding transcriptional LysR family regulator
MRAGQLDGLLTFLSVARKRSFTAAAAELEISTQAVSHAIKTLEARLQTRLFHRTTRSISLTEAGEKFLARVAPAVSEVIEATETLQLARRHPSGILRLNLPRTAYGRLIEPRLAEFHRSFPDVRLDLTFDEGFVDIVERGFDAGIRLGEYVAKDMVSVPLTPRDRIVIVAAPAYLSRRGVPKNIADLQTHDCIRMRGPATGAIYRWELTDRGKEVEVGVSGPVTVNDAGAQVTIAVEGLGLAYVLESVARPYLASGRLRSVLDSVCPDLPGFHLYYPKQRQISLKLRSFVDFWRARARGAQVRRQSPRR